MQTPKFLVYDTETTSLDSRVGDLLECYFSVLDEDYDEIDYLYLKLKPNNNRLIQYEMEAMEVNKIDLQKHIEVAISYEEGKEELISFLSCYGAKLINVGHNIEFDNDWIKTKLPISIKEWHKLFGRNNIDTKNTVEFLKLVGKLPANISTSLGKLAKHFSIPRADQNHNCEDDVFLTVSLLKKLSAIALEPPKTLWTFTTT